jgi:hypothetical protein
LAVGEAAGDRDRPGPGGAGAPGRGGLAGAATAGPGRHRPLMGRSGCVGARCRRVDGRDARSHTFWSCCCSSRSALCPGFMGRLAGRLMSRVSPAVVQRLLDLLVGGALLAQVTLATGPGAPPGHRWDGSEVVSTASLAIGGSVGPSTLSGLATTSHAGDGVAGHSRRWDRPERGPLPAGQRRRCRPGWGGRAVQRGAQSRRRGWRDRGARAQQQPRHLGSAWASPGTGRPKGCSTATASAWCPRAERPFRILRLPWQGDGASTGAPALSGVPSDPANLHGAGPGVGVPGYMLQPLDISRRRTTRTPSGSTGSK